MSYEEKRKQELPDYLRGRLDKAREDGKTSVHIGISRVEEWLKFIEQPIMDKGDKHDGI